MSQSRATWIATLLIRLFVCATPLSAFGEDTYEALITPDQMIPMRDGIKLATDIYRPAKNGTPVEGKFPALLIRTPYNKSDDVESFARYFVSYGYVFIVQDVRGRYKSEGHWRPLYDDGHDGFDTTQWIGHQPWSDRGVGTTGGSYEGGTQHALAIDDAPFLKAQMPLFSASGVGRYGLRGRLIVKLWASSNGPDTDFTAKLVDVYPPNSDFPAGVDLNIGDGIVRARYRNSDTKAEILQPGKPYEFTIEMYPTSILFKRGHRIRLDISSSNFPRFDVNPNTGEPMNANRSWRIAENSIFLDPAHPSQLLLPIIPAQSDPGTANDPSQQ